MGQANLGRRARQLRYQGFTSDFAVQLLRKFAQTGRLALQALSTFLEESIGGPRVSFECLPWFAAGREAGHHIRRQLCVGRGLAHTKVAELCGRVAEFGQPNPRAIERTVLAAENHLTIDGAFPDSVGSPHSEAVPVAIAIRGRRHRAQDPPREDIGSLEGGQTEFSAGRVEAVVPTVLVAGED